MYRAISASANRDARHGSTNGALLLPIDRVRQLDPQTRQVISLVAAARGVPRALLLHPTRCTAQVAAARQLAMYLLHVVLRCSYAGIAQQFGRDRTTVAHACAVIEDLRDSPSIDAEVLELETQLTAVVGGAEAVNAAR